jgi:amino acid adenylation domain-containing protein
MLHERGVQVWAENGKLRCAAPAGVISEDLLAELKGRKGELLQLLDGSRGRSGGVFKMPKARGGGRHPLSFSQRRIWMMYEMEVASYAYHFLGKMEIRGSFDIEAWTAALQAVVARHGSLRTRIVKAGEEAVQIVESEGHLPVPILDFSHFSEEESESKIAALMVSQRDEPFDLSSAPLSRASIVRQGPDKHVFLITIHHIISDGWSVGNLIRDLFALYRGRVLGEEYSLEGLDYEYVDFAEWQLGQLESDEYQDQLKYWKEQLAGSPPLLTLPSQRSRPVVGAFRGRVLRFSLGIEQTKLIREAARRHGASVFMVVLALFKTLLHLYTGATDLVIGTVIANRQKRELEGIMGIFINTLVLRAKLNPNASFADFLSRVRDTTLEAYANQDYPFEKLVEVVRPIRQASHNPLFQVMVLFQNTPMPEIKLPGLDIHVDEVESNSAPFDMTVTFADMTDEMSLSINYDVDLFSESFVVSLVDRFTGLIDLRPWESAAPIRNYQALSEAERRLFLTGYNETPAEHERQCLHEDFQRAAADNRDRVALVDDSGAYTYDLLERETNRLAWLLIERGVGLESLAVIYMKRSVHVVTAMLAVLKAGGAYVPIDPEMPADRIRAILEKAKPGVILTDSSLEPHIPVGEWSVLSLEAARSLAAGRSDRKPDVEVSPENLAYVIFTSGSTGMPKGVAVTHRNVTRLLRATAGRDFVFSRDDVWTFFHSAAFDFSVWEIWGALTTGAKLVVVPYVMSRDPAAFAQLLIRERVTVLNQTPTAFSLLSSEVLSKNIHPRDFSLRYIIFGGEKLGLETLRPWLERFGENTPVLVNMYGITETTVHVSFWKIGFAEIDGAEGNSYIGSPIDDLRIHLLNPSGMPVPVDAEGEIYVSGPGVSRGYLGDPRQTATVFVPSPTGGKGDWSRSYRSGDIAKNMNPYGLSYIKRGDRQCKIRGFRIELGEIENALQGHSGIRFAAACVCGTEKDQTIEGYYVEDIPGSISGGDLRSYLAERLPAYMIPARLVALESIPLTLNGKLDRLQLPAMGDNLEKSNSERVGPLTPLHVVLMDIWKKVLQIGELGPDDDFFEVGGHSLAAIQLVNEVRQRFQCDYSVSTFFNNSTIAGMAENLSKDMVMDKFLCGNIYSGQI